MAKRKRRKFTKEFRAEVVKVELDGGRSVPDVCREQNLGETSVYNWVKRAQVDRGNGAAGVLTTAEKGAAVAVVVLS